MLNRDDTLARLADSAIDAFAPNDCSEQRVNALRSFFPDSLIVAAFDLIDRGCVNKSVAPWGRVHYHVAGSADKYTVTIDPAFCSCPAFAYGVLVSDAYPLCKHVLAVRLGEKLSKCREFVVTAEDLVAVIATPDISSHVQTE